MKKLALAAAVGAAALFASADAHATSSRTHQDGQAVAKAAANTDVSARHRHFRVIRHYGYRPYYRSYAYRPYYRSYAYAPAPYYYGYGGPSISFSFGGGHRWHRW